MSSEMEASTMKQDETTLQVPKLRFSEFQNTGEWKVSSIGDLKPFVTSGSRGWAPFYADKGDLFVRITNLWRDSIYLDLTDSKFVQLPSGASEGVRTQLKEHDVLISITADIGIIGYVDESVTSPAYINQHIALVRLDKEQLCGKYVAYFLASEQSQRLFRSSTDIGTKAGMSLTGIHKIQLTFPGLPEQQHIAEFLTSVDKLIATQARKVDVLKSHKKGLMQQLFPREGEAQPRLRFPEFQDAGEWVMRRLGDFADVSASGDLDSATFSPERSEVHCFPIYSNGVESEGIYGYSSVAKHQANSVTITARGTLGRAFLRTVGFVGIGRLIVVTNFFGEVDARFLKECWDHVAFIPQEVTSIPQLTAVAARAAMLPFPALPEQQRIASCLSSLDALITAETQKHETLQTHKKGLMQQLFPSAEESLP
jgi:type I restriction enzyme S subunit